MRFAVTFHNGFRVATGTARFGVDDTVDPDDPLPGSTWKGLMRAAARTLLPHPPGEHPLVVDVFGSPRQPSRWNWGSAVLDTPASQRVRAAIAVDEDGAAARDMLRFADELWTDAASFEVIQTGTVADLDRHQLLLACAAQAVHSLGSDRRRGLGWVSVRCLDRAVGAAEVDELLRLRAEPAR